MRGLLLLLFAVVLCAQPQQQMLIANVVPAAGGGSITATNTGNGLCAGANGGTTFSLGTTAATGNFVVVAMSSQGGGQSVSDNKGNTYTAMTVTGGVTPPEGFMFYAANAAGGSSHSITTGGAFVGACAAVFTGLTSSPFDKEAHTADHVGTTFQAGSVALASTPSLVVTMINGTPPTSIDSSFITSGILAFSGGVNYPVALYYKITSTTENPTVSLGSSQNTTGQNAVFK